MELISNDHHKLTVGLRWVACFEATKGLIVIIAGLGLLSLVHHDLLAVARQLVTWLHLNPEKHMARLFLGAATNLDDNRLRLLAILALIYSTMRFAEAYGLWFEKRWAEWFAVISYGIYIPIEMFELCHGFGWVKIIALIFNVLIVVYVASFMVVQRQSRKQVLNPNIEILNPKQ